METLLIIFCLILLIPALWSSPMVLVAVLRFPPIALFIVPPFVGYFYCVYQLYLFLQPYAAEASNWYLVIFVPLLVASLYGAYWRLLKR